jgi:hypothetical protein
MRDREYHSVNDKTGMLEDIEEIRDAGAKVADILQTIIKHPLFQVFTDFGLLFDTASFAVSAESMFRPMSQAEYYQKLGEAVGIDPLVVAREIAAGGLSDTLPPSHPEAPKMDAPQLDPNDPVVKSSAILSYIANERGKDVKPEEKVELPLPEGLESFLRDLLSKDTDPDQEERKD